MKLAWSKCAQNYSLSFFKNITYGLRFGFYFILPGIGVVLMPVWVGRCTPGPDYFK